MIIRPSHALLLAAGLAAAACRPPAGAPGPAASIRDVDFRNFRYRFQDQAWTLADGVQPDAGEEEWRYELDGVAYGDVTGDGREEALVTVTAVTGGTMVPHWVFVYGAGSRGPELLWSFESGDRAAGGLKRVHADGGTLVVELYGKDKVPGDPERLYAEDGTSRGACCPTVFTRSRWEWNGRALVPRGGPEVLPYEPEG